MKQKQLIFLFIGIVFFGALLRFYNLNWDQGFHMHPDERAITLFTIKLLLPNSLEQFFSPDSPWNPHFFAYGSFPLYLLWFTGHALQGINPLFAAYDKINLVGRGISALFDVGTLMLLYFLGKTLYERKVGLVASFFYAISVLPIQLSHFYAVDTLLTFFITGTLFVLILYVQEPTQKKAILIGLLFGFALATKISASVLALSIGIALLSDLFYVVFTHTQKLQFRIVLKRLLIHGSILALTTILIYFICEPYAFIGTNEFLRQTAEQSQMTKSAFTFPYTLQYVGKIPYIYELKNIFFYGLGPILATLSFVGIFFITKRTFFRKEKDSLVHSIMVSFFWVYFLIVGHFAIGFMRYMLPLYPILILAASAVTLPAIHSIKKKFQTGIIFPLIVFCFLLLLLIWPLSFMQMYKAPNTRVTATNFILKQIPSGSKIALEHWDDALPLTGQEQYQLLTLPLYDPDTPTKWQQVDETLKQTDYIILASNRLYVPLQKLTHCDTLPIGRCYPITAKYYKHLFTGQNVLMESSESATFTKIADISNPPTIPFTNIPLNDQSADESFTVYDHPRIIIFQKNK